MTRGRFVTFEGGEGAGKSTQIGHLADFLRSQGKAVVTTREPGGAPGAEEIRAILVSGAEDRWDPTAEVLLHFAARREHLVRTVWPGLERGEWVLSDRFADSTVAYQGYGSNVPRDVIARVYELAVGAFHPDLTFILDVPVKLGLARARARLRGRSRFGAAKARAMGGDRYESMDRRYHERLRQGFLDIARAEPDRCRIVDATRDEAIVAAEIAAMVRETFPADFAGRQP